MTYNEFERRLYNADTKEDTVRLCVDNLAHAKRVLDANESAAPYRRKEGAMKQAIYNYLREELYPCPSCDHCQYRDFDTKRAPCVRCNNEWEMYKLHMGHTADLRRMARKIAKIAKEKIMGTKTFKIRTSMRGFKQWMDEHPRQNLTGFFSHNGRDMTDVEIRRIVSYAVENGYDTDADIPSEEIARILSQKQKKEKKMDKNRNWKNGDVLVDELTRQPFLFWKMEGGKIYTHCGIDSEGRFCLGCEDWSNAKACRLAKEEEKKRLREEMKKRGLVFLPESGYLDIIHENAICNTALEHYGVHSQMVKCMEECGELIQALARNLIGEHNEENVVEELADVEITLMQMRTVFGRHEAHRVMAQKLARLKMRMEEEEA